MIWVIHSIDHVARSTYTRELTEGDGPEMEEIAIDQKTLKHLNLHLRLWLTKRIRDAATLCLLRQRFRTRGRRRIAKSDVDAAVHMGQNKPQGCELHPEDPTAKLRAESVHGLVRTGRTRQRKFPRKGGGALVMP